METASRADTLINLKIFFEGQIYKYKLLLRELVPSILPEKICYLLEIPPNPKILFERYSDSAGAYVALDPNNFSAYKQLYRAARAKLRLRLRVTNLNELENRDSYYPQNHNRMGSFDAPSHLLKQNSMAQNARFPSVSKNCTTDIQQDLQRLCLGDKVNIDNTTSSEKCKVNVPTTITNPGAPAHMICPYITKMMTKNEHDRSINYCDTASHQASGRNTGKIRPSSAVLKAIHDTTVICNNCNSLLSEEHYHCCNCDGGDYDLCQGCVDKGVACYDDNHWLIKRVFQDGKLVNSTTQTVTPKSPPKPEEFISPNQNTTPRAAATHTCNCCITELNEENFVTCTTCPDYDLCISCHLALKHGHHPKHAFEPIVKDKITDKKVQILLAPGRNIEHNATCDGCQKLIYGVRHKCLDCPDWDYCSACIPKASSTHPQHRFIPIYEPYEDLPTCKPSCPKDVKHFGVFCDGLLCKNVSTYINGDRYKCAVCDDIDFCASCEASPMNEHSHIHPMIKLKTPAYGLDVTVLNNKQDGHSTSSTSDKQSPICIKADAMPSALPMDVATQVHTIFDLKASEIYKSENTQVSEDPIQLGAINSNPNELPNSTTKLDHVAEFVSETITDGTILQPGEGFTQTWYLRNSGNNSWPSGCYVKFVAGKNMCNIDNNYPESIRTLVSSYKSSVYNSTVAPGRTVGFTVNLKAPYESGNFISYWCLASPDDLEFGKKLWVDVIVNESETASRGGLNQGENSESFRATFPSIHKIETSSSHALEKLISNSTTLETEDSDDLIEEELRDDLVDFDYLTDEFEILDASDEECIARRQRMY